MRKIAILTLAASASLALAACSEKTQEHAESTVEAMGDDMEGAAAKATLAADKGAQELSTAAGQAADAARNAADNAVKEAAGAAGKLGGKIQQEAAEVEAGAQNEPVDKAKAD